MKALKTILGLTYPILIILLLLNCKGCKREVNPEPSPINPDTPTVVIDTTATEVVRKAQAIGSTGALKITLLWNFHADLDLHVKQPNGNVIYYKQNRDNSTGGYLDVDNREGGEGAAENTYWNEPPKGQYLVGIDYFGRAEVSKMAESGICTIVVFQEGKQPIAYNVSMSTLKEFKNVVSITIE